MSSASPPWALEVVCLGQGQAPCTLLRYRHVNVLLDCGLSLSSSLHLRPREDAEDAAAPRGPVPLRCQGTQPAAPVLGPLLQVARLHPIHAVLISSAEGLLGLPLLMAQHPDARSWAIFSTLAAFDIAKHLAADLCDTARRMESVAWVGLPGAQGGELDAGRSGRRPAAAAADGACGSAWDVPCPEAVGWELPAGAQGRQLYEACWQRRFSAAEAADCFARVKVVRYGEHVSLDDMYLGAVAYPSGSGTGHALWVVSDSSQRIGYAARLSLEPGHSLEMESGTLGGLGALILAPGCVQQEQEQQQQQQQQQHAMPVHTAPARGTQDQNRNQVPVSPGPAAGRVGQGGARASGAGPSPAARVSVDVIEACQQVVSTLKAGGCALILVTASGAAWPLIEALASHLDQAGLQDRRLYYVAAAARDSLALACTSPEFLSRSKQAQVHQACAPFQFDAMLASGRLCVAASLADRGLQAAWSEPAVVLAPVCSLESGAARQLLNKWGDDPRSLLLLATESPCGGPSIGDAIDAAALHLPLTRTSSGHGSRAGAPPAIRLLACNLAAPAPRAHQLAQLLTAARPSRLIMWGGDLAKLQALPPQTKAALHSHVKQVVAYSWLQAAGVQLMPGPSLPPCGLNNQAAAQLRWTSMPMPTPGRQQQQQQEALVANFRATLTLHDKGHWQLSPGQPASAAPLSLPAAAAEALSQPRLWRRPALTDLLRQLRDRGFHWLDVRVEGGQEQEEQAVVVTLYEPEGTIRLGHACASVLCNDASTRTALYTCVAAAAQVKEVA